MGNPINNLGDYGWVTTAAKEAGGVNMLIQNIEDTAVELAKSGLVNRGRVEGAAVSIGALACLNLINKAIPETVRFIITILRCVISRTIVIFFLCFLSIKLFLRMLSCLGHNVFLTLPKNGRRSPWVKLSHFFRVSVMFYSRSCLSLMIEGPRTK